MSQRILRRVAGKTSRQNASRSRIKYMVLYLIFMLIFPSAWHRAEGLLVARLDHGLAAAQIRHDLPARLHSIPVQKREAIPPASSLFEVLPDTPGIADFDTGA